MCPPSSGRVSFALHWQTAHVGSARTSSGPRSCPYPGHRQPGELTKGVRPRVCERFSARTTSPRSASVESDPGRSAGPQRKAPHSTRACSLLAGAGGFERCSRTGARSDRSASAVTREVARTTSGIPSARTVTTVTPDPPSGSGAPCSGCSSTSISIAETRSHGTTSKLRQPRRHTPLGPKSRTFERRGCRRRRRRLPSASQPDRMRTPATETAPDRPKGPKTRRSRHHCPA